MRNATRTAVPILSIYAGLLGAAHGYFEIRQGNTAPAEVMIVAMGAPCQPEGVSHACWPAMTLIPNFQITGLLAVAASAAALIWGVGFIERKQGSLILALLAVIMLLVGGGFLPPFYMLIAAAAGTRIHAPLTEWRQRLAPKVLSGLAALWPWLLVVYLLWAGIQLVFGEGLNDFLLSSGGLFFPLEIVSLMVAVVSAIAHDARMKNSDTPA
jgi:hypothetical protein